MPGIWRLLLSEASRLWLLIVGGAVAFMLVAQMHEIARFAALCSSPVLLLRFIGLQLPYVLPNAMPLAALLAAYWTFRRLSIDGELTSLRAGGCSLGQLLIPLLLWGALLGLITFGIASEIAPSCRSRAKSLVDEVASANPLTLIHQKRLMRLTECWVQAEPEGHDATRDLWMVLPTGKEQRLTVLHADRVSLQRGLIDAQGVLALQHRPEGDRDQIWLEESQQVTLEATSLSPLLLKGALQRAEDYLGWRGQWALALEGSGLAWHELLRRIVLGLAPLCMIPLGAAFGTTTARHPSRLDLLIPLLSAFAVLGGFIAGKSLPHVPFAYLPLFVAPMLWSVMIASWRLWRLNGGWAS